MNKSWLFILLIVLLFTGNPIAHASPQDDLEKTQKEEKEISEKNKQLEEDAKVLAKKKAELSAKMVKTASDLQKSEARLSAIEDKLRILSEQITEKTNTLNTHRKNLAVMVQASLKLSRTPPEAIIIMPGDMLDNMKASRALKMTSDSIKKETEIINLQMIELAELQKKATINKEEALKEKEELDKQRKLLKAQIDEHSELQRKLNIAQKETKAKLQALAKKASSLKELISSLENEKKLQSKKRKSDIGDDIAPDERVVSGEKGRIRSVAAARGNMRVPAAGKLIQRFGAEGRNETSKGITIQTRANAQVTAPYDAEVLFTGPFMEYGKVVILRHSDGFHTLLAGINEIDVSVGDFLLEGEPIGAMGEDEEQNKLYLELREDGQPTNPANWIRGLNK